MTITMIRRASPFKASPTVASALPSALASSGAAWSSSWSSSWSSWVPCMTTLTSHEKQQRNYSYVRAHRISGGGRMSKFAGSSISIREVSSNFNSNSNNNDSSSSSTSSPYNLIFVRHGQSTWNRSNRFIGWTDTPLTPQGVLEARLAGKLLLSSIPHLHFEEVHTSLLRRSIRTVNLILMELSQEYIPVYKHWRLNERNYGELVGKNKKEVVKLFGKDLVKKWRRSYGERPPPMGDDHEFHPKNDPRYKWMLDQIPSSESLADTLARSSIYWDQVIAPSLRGEQPPRQQQPPNSYNNHLNNNNRGKTILIVGHENNLRSLIMRLEDISEEDIIELNLPRAIPLAYRLDENLKPIPPPEKKISNTNKGGVNGINGINNESKKSSECDILNKLNGTWLGGLDAVKQILERDHKQVYDTTIDINLEEGSEGDKWRKWTELELGLELGDAYDVVRNDNSSGAAGSVSGGAEDHVCFEALAKDGIDDGEVVGSNNRYKLNGMEDRTTIGAS